MNEIKMWDIRIGYSNKTKRYNVLPHVICFLEEIRNEIMKNNKVPMLDAKYKKYIQQTNKQIGYAYLGNDDHEFALLKPTKQGIKVLDKVNISIQFIEDDEYIDMMFMCYGDDKYERYTNIRKTLKIDKYKNEVISTFDPLNFLNSILKPN